MKLNVGSADRLIRLLVGVFLVLTWFAGWITGVWAIVLGAVGVVVALTSFMGSCPLYTLLGISTKKSTS